MTSQNGATKSSRAAIKELLEGRTKILERLAGQLDKWEQAKAAVATAQTRADDEVAAARTIYQEAMDAGWTAAELAGAGLKPPAPPRRRSAAADATSGSKQPASSSE